MILVPNLLQRLSGNKIFLVFAAVLIFFSACSKKIVPVKEPEVKPAPVIIEKPKVEAPVEKKKTDHSIALLLPFHLNSVDVKTATKKEIGLSEMAIDFYQGFKLGIDSISIGGHNFQVNVFDTETGDARIVNLANSESVKQQDLIIGPVFPEAIAAFSKFKKPGEIQVSPLAATMPIEFNNPNLITINNTLDQHGLKIAEFITKKYRPESVHIVLINTQKTEDARFSNYLKEGFNKLSASKFQITERPNAIGIETYLDHSKINLVLITSSDRSFLLSAIDKLHKLKEQDYKIEIFGHPNWIKAKYLNANKMQDLNARISSSYYVNYKSQNVKQFVARYRDEYKLEPSEFSFKGFDIAYYFGSMMQKYGKDYMKHLGDKAYEGLHNKFRFSKSQEFGYINEELFIMRYHNFELQPEK